MPIEYTHAPNEFTNLDDGSPSPEIRDQSGDYRQLGCILSNNPRRAMATMESAGLRTWSKNEILDAIKGRPAKSRDIFEPSKWLEDQKQRGSCCPTATTAASRKAAFYAGLSDIPRLSAEFLYAQVNRGQDNGAILSEAEQAIKTVGQIVRDDSKHPFNRDILAKNYSPEEYRDALKWRAGVTVEIHSEMELATLVLSRSGGVVVAVDVDNSFMTLNRDGICGGGRGPGNHAVHVDDVEIINGELAFDMANSWGLNFGDNGRAYLTWNRHFSNTFRNHQFFAIMGSSYDSLRDEGPAVKV